MASWLIPALRAVLPHVGDLVNAARPVFTGRKTAGPAPEGGALIEQQIAELQAAAAQNAANVKELAAQLQSTVAALELTAQLAEVRLRRALFFCALAMGISVAALGLSFFIFLAR